MCYKLKIILNILIIVIIISFFTEKNKTTIDMITFIFALFGIIEVNTNMIPRINYYKLTKQKNSIINSKVTYIFKKNNFKLNKDDFIDYKNLKKVIETNSCYYLYITSSKSLIVDKSSLKDEEITTLSNKFKETVSTYKYKK